MRSPGPRNTRSHWELRGALEAARADEELLEAARADEELLELLSIYIYVYVNTFIYRPIYIESRS